MIWNIISILGGTALLILAIIGGIALLGPILPDPSRRRAIPTGTSRGRRVTDVQLKAAHAISNAEDLAHRRELAEGRV